MFARLAIRCSRVQELRLLHPHYKALVHKKSLLPRTERKPLSRHSSQNLEFAISNPSYFRVMFRPELKPDDEDVEIGRFGAVAFGILKKCIELNIAEGRFVERNVDDLAIVAWSTVHGLAVLWVNGNLHPLPDGKKILRPALAESVASLIVSGMLRPEIVQALDDYRMRALEI